MLDPNDLGLPLQPVETRLQPLTEEFPFQFRLGLESVIVSGGAPHVQGRAAFQQFCSLEREGRNLPRYLVDGQTEVLASDNRFLASFREFEHWHPVDRQLRRRRSFEGHLELLPGDLVPFVSPGTVVFRQGEADHQETLRARRKSRFLDGKRYFLANSGRDI